MDFQRDQTLPKKSILAKPTVIDRVEAVRKPLDLGNEWKGEDWVL
jgi:hypothetical protein